jgi:hypothetical protein
MSLINYKVQNIRFLEAQVAGNSALRHLLVEPKVLQTIQGYGNSLKNYEAHRLIIQTLHRVILQNHPSEWISCAIRDIDDIASLIQKIYPTDMYSATHINLTYE